MASQLGPLCGGSNQATVGARFGAVALGTGGEGRCVLRVAKGVEWVRRRWRVCGGGVNGWRWGGRSGEGNIGRGRCVKGETGDGGEAEGGAVWVAGEEERGGASGLLRCGGEVKATARGVGRVEN